MKKNKWMVADGGEDGRFENFFESSTDSGGLVGECKHYFCACFSCYARLTNDPWYERRGDLFLLIPSPNYRTNFSRLSRGLASAREYRSPYANRSANKNFTATHLYLCLSCCTLKNYCPGYKLFLLLFSLRLPFERHKRIFPPSLSLSLDLKIEFFFRKNSNFKKVIIIGRKTLLRKKSQRRKSILLFESMISRHYEIPIVNDLRLEHSATYHVRVATISERNILQLVPKRRWYRA